MKRRNASKSQRDVMDLSNCTNANLRKATRAVTQLYDVALHPTGLRATQFALLGALSKCGPLPLSQLAEAIVMDRTTLSRNLKPLVSRNLVHIGAGQDQRVRNISLTEDGRDALAEATAFWKKAQARVADALGQKRWNDLLDNLSIAVDVVRTG